MAEEKSTDKKENRERPEETSVWEWIIAAVGLVLVVGAIGSTLYRALTQESTPPQLAVSVDSVQPSGDGFLVKFRVVNSGNQTAAAANIEGELKSGEETAETSSATLTYIPANSERRGGLFFNKNPQQFDLRIRATGYEEP
jgi:uncharacterized protein (TIGR02588 family)